MSFGNTTIVFKRLVKVPGTVDEQGNSQMATVDTVAPGCRHRPLTFKETAELELDVSTEYWRSTLPLKDYSPNLISAITDAAGNDRLYVDGDTFHIIGGVRPHGDLASVPFKMTIISQRQTG